MKNLFKKQVKKKYPKAILNYSGNSRIFYVKNIPFNLADEYWVTQLAKKHKCFIAIV